MRPELDTRRFDYCHAQNHVVPHWTLGLPRAWQEMVDPPMRLERFDEPSARAWRCVGFDADEAQCHVRYAFELTALRCETDEGFYEELDYAETVIAWRLRDGRWLTYRAFRKGAECCTSTAFFSLAESPPR